MKKTPAEGMIPRLFEGKSQMFIECVNVDYKSERTEVFHDLQLNVKVPCCCSAAALLLC